MFLSVLILALVQPLLSPAPRGLPAGAPECAGNYSLEEILAAIRGVETGGEQHGGRFALGDGGLALGPFQIQRSHWIDAGLPGRYEDCRDPAYARREVLAYWERWCPQALARNDAEVLARVHNGGPRGAAKDSTLAYWDRTRTRLAATRVERGVSAAPVFVRAKRVL